MTNLENGNSYGPNSYRSFDDLLGEAGVAVYKSTKDKPPVSGQVLTPVADIDGDTSLVFGNFQYRKRIIGVEGRSLTEETTIQPVFALVEGDGVVTPLPYGENVAGLRAPLAADVVSYLEKLRKRGNIV